MRLASLITSLILIAVTATRTGAQVANNADQFSIASNPNGNWTYGFSDSLGSPLVLYTRSSVESEIEAWWGDRVADGNPHVWHNPNPYDVYHGTELNAAHEALAHPGPNGEVSIYRWTVPATDAYTITASFVGRNSLGDSVDVHVTLNGASLYSENLTGYGNPVSFSTQISMSSGDLLDFAVGAGGNGYFNDSTGVLAQIGPIPEPTAAMSAVAFAAVALQRRHRGVRT